MSSARKTSSAVIAAILLVVIFVAICAITARRSFRLDLTEDNRYTLAEGLKAILTQVAATEEIVEVVAYLTDKVPGSALAARDQLRDLVNDIELASRGAVTVTYVDPTESDSLAEEAADYGVIPVQMFDPSGSQATITTVYAGVVVKRGGEYEAVPQLILVNRGGVQLDPEAEYLIAAALKKVGTDERKTIGYLSGHGEPSMGHAEQENSILARLERVYGTVECNTAMDGIVPETVDLLLIRAPSQLEPRDQYAVDQFILTGKPVIILAPRTLIVPPGQLSSTAYPLHELVEHYGIKVDTGILVDSARRGPLQIQIGGRPAKWPMLDLGEGCLDRESKITALLEGLGAFLANPLVASDSLGQRSITPLVLPPAEAGTIDGVHVLEESMFGPVVGADATVSPMPEGSAIYALIQGPAESFFKDKEIPDPPEPSPNRQAPPQEPPFVESAERVNIFVSSFDFLGDARGFDLITNTMDNMLLGEDLISIRSRQVESRPIQLMTKGAEEAIRDGVVEKYKALDEAFEMNPTRSTFLGWSTEQQERWLEAQKELNEKLDVAVMAKRFFYQSFNIAFMPVVIIVLAFLRLAHRRYTTRRKFKAGTT